MSTQTICVCVFFLWRNKKNIYLISKTNFHGETRNVLVWIPHLCRAMNIFCMKNIFLELSHPVLLRSKNISFFFNISSSGLHAKYVHYLAVCISANKKLFNSQKVLIFFLYLHKNIFCGTHYKCLYLYGCLFSHNALKSIFGPNPVSVHIGIGIDFGVTVSCLKNIF